MSIPVITILALIAITFLYLMVVLARGRMRAQMRDARLRDAADPARGSAPDAEHDAG